MPGLRTILLLTASAVNCGALAQSYEHYVPAATGDGSLMIVVWDVINGATLIDQVSGYSMNDIASQPHVFFNHGLPAEAGTSEVHIGSIVSTAAEQDGRRLPWPFSVGQQLSAWDDFLNISSGNPNNFRFTVSAGDNNSDGATSGDVYAAVAFTSGSLDPADELNNESLAMNPRAFAAAHDEHFEPIGITGTTVTMHKVPIWNRATFGRINEPVSFWLSSSGWPGTKTSDRSDDVAVKIEQFPHQWTLDTSGCLRYNAGNCRPFSAPQYISEEWPKPLPNNWTLGWVSDVAVDSQNHVWVLNRPTVFANQTNDNPSGQPIPLHTPAPAVIEFNQAGEVLRSWGGQAWNVESQSWQASIDGWPFNYEHGIYIDPEDNVWITWAIDQHLVMKFTPDGEPLLTIGKVGETGGNDNKELLGGPADVVVDEIAREVFIADGYINQRVIVYDSDTGVFKRQWGVYGKAPVVGDTTERSSINPEVRFVGPVHGIAMASDGLLYVVDREALRTQVFRKDGSYVTEIHAPAFDVALSPDPNNQLLYLGRAGNAGGALMLGGGVFMLDRLNPGVAAYFGETGIPRLHGMTVDQSGNVYTAELRFGISKHSIRPN